MPTVVTWTVQDGEGDGARGIIPPPPRPPLASPQVSKIPVTTSEVLASSLMGMFEKRRFRNFLLYMVSE